VFLSSWILIGILLAVVLVGTRGMKRDPIGLQNLLEFLWNFIRDIARDNIGEKYYRDWLPFIGTLFLFIFVSNWGGALIPWKIFELPEGELGAPTADINTTVAMALLVSLAYFYAGLSRKGLRFFELYVEPTPIMLPFKIIEEFTKPLSLSFRSVRKHPCRRIGCGRAGVPGSADRAPACDASGSVHQCHSGSDLRDPGVLLHR